MEFGDHEVIAPIVAPGTSTTNIAPSSVHPVDPLACLNLVGIDQLAQPLPPLRFVIGQLLPKNSIAVLAGPAGSRKSWVALDACVAIAAGDRCMGRFPTERGKVFYLNYEASNESLRRRCQMIVRARGGTWPPNLVVGELPTAGLADGAFLAAIERMVQVYAPALVVIDTYRAALPGIDENDSAGRQYIDRLRRSGAPAETSFLIVTHTRKLRDGQRALTQEDVRGSGALVEAADVVFVLSKPKEKNDLAVLVQTKARDTAELDDLCIDVVDRDGGVAVVAMRKDGVDQGEDSNSSAFEHKVLSFINANPGCAKRAIRNGVQGSNDKIDSTLAVLVKRGLVINNGSTSRGAFSLSAVLGAQVGGTA